jgi:hypothetical protein
VVGGDSSKEWRLRWYPRLALLCLVTGLLVAVLASHGADGPMGRLGGDFPAFYGAGLAVREGGARSLYDFADQKARQAHLFPTDESGSTIPFPYPAFVAVAFYPFALMPYRLSFLVYALFMMGAVAWTMKLFASRFSLLAGFTGLATVAAIFYYPLLRSILGGQNSAITLLLFAIVWKLNVDGREWLAGLFLGLMFFKPQYGVPLMGLHLVAFRWRTVASTVTVALALAAVGMIVSGPSWVSDWLHYASWVSNVAASIDAPNSVGWLGFLEAVLGRGSGFARVFGWTLAAATMIGVSLVWYTGRGERDMTPGFAVAAPALLLMQPHAMYYDMALLIFTYAAYCQAGRSWSKSVVLMWILALSQVVARPLGFSPAFFLVVAAGMMAGLVVLRKRQACAERPETLSMRVE